MVFWVFVVFNNDELKEWMKVLIIVVFVGKYFFVVFFNINEKKFVFF